MGRGKLDLPFDIGRVRIVVDAGVGVLESGADYVVVGDAEGEFEAHFVRGGLMKQKVTTIASDVR